MDEMPACTWRPRGWHWLGACGFTWEDPYADTPKEGHMNFCPKCGGRIVEGERIEEDDDDI